MVDNHVPKQILYGRLLEMETTKKTKLGYKDICKTLVKNYYTSHDDLKELGKRLCDCADATIFAEGQFSDISMDVPEECSGSP